jgi:hypothetical protein
LRCAILVAESEFGKEKAVLDDFHKLVLARADHRVIVFQGHGKGIGKLMDDLEKAATAYAGPTAGDRYLMVAYDTSGRRAAHRLIVIDQPRVD